VAGLSQVTDIAAGGYHSCAVRSTGRVFCWGNNEFGQLGDTTTIQRQTPVRVASLSGITQIAAGGGHNCALRSTGRVFCWGDNHTGQLGDGTTTSRHTPVRVVNLSAVTQIAAGGRVPPQPGFFDQSCAVRATGRAFCWGYNGLGQLGDGTNETRLAPVRVVTLPNVEQMSVGRLHSCGLRENGQAFCWGANFTGELGDGTTTHRWTPAPVSE
jgi:alpha-tubulin suppressor-like RCC1 family protein